MKQQVNPMLAVGVAAVVLIVAVFFVMRGTGSPAGSSASDKPYTPPGVADDFAKRMGNTQGAGGAPRVSGGGGQGAPLSTTMMPPGSGAGYMAPPPPGR